MRKRLMTLLLLLLCVLITACGTEPLPESSQIPDAFESSSEQTASSEVTEPALSRVDGIACTPVMLSDPAFTVLERFADRYYGNLSVYDSAQGILSVPCFSDPVTKEKTVLSYPVGFPNWTVASGCAVVMDDRFLYEWKSYSSEFAEDSLQDVKLTRIDGMTGAVEVVDEVLQNSPFAYLCKIDETRFLSYTVLREASEQAEYATATTAYLYDTNGEKTQIIREVYENEEGWLDSKGILIERFAVHDGNIIGFGRRNEDGNYRFYLYHYDFNGRLLQTVPLQGMENILGTEQPVEFYQMGNYLALRTFETLSTYICSLNDGKLSYVTKGLDGSVQYSVAEDRIYFIESNVDVYTGELKAGDFPLYCLDTGADELRSYDVKLPLEQPYFVGIKALTGGDVLLSYCPNGYYDPMDTVQFLILAGDLK